MSREYGATHLESAYIVRKDVQRAIIGPGLLVEAIEDCAVGIGGGERKFAK